MLLLQKKKKEYLVGLLADELIKKDKSTNRFNLTKKGNKFVKLFLELAELTPNTKSFITKKILLLLNIILLKTFQNLISFNFELHSSGVDNDLIGTFPNEDYSAIVQELVFKNHWNEVKSLEIAFLGVFHAEGYLYRRMIFSYFSCIWIT